MQDKASPIPSELSGGQQQCIAIAKALVNDADIILADESCGNLDEKNSRMIYVLLATLKSDKTVVIVSYNPALVQGIDNCIVLNNGMILNDN